MPMFSPKASDGEPSRAFSGAVSRLCGPSAPDSLVSCQEVALRLRLVGGPAEIHRRVRGLPARVLLSQGSARRLSPESFRHVPSPFPILLLIVREPEGGLPVDVTVRPFSLRVVSPEGCTEVALPAGVRLAPSSCRGLSYVSGDGLHLRLQARAEPSATLTSDFHQSSPAQACCTFYCQCCGEVLIKDRTLLRVLPLPSENWGALVGEWCCHPDPFANRPLHPRENDCFTGDSFFLVNLRSNVWQEPKANTKVICKRCKVVLGEIVSSETTKFYKTEVIIQPSERSFPIIPRSQFVESAVAQCLQELSSARSTFRYTVQGQEGKVYVLLWLLNLDSLVVDSLRSSKHIKKFPLFEDTLKSSSSSARNAVKVLYQPCIRSRNEKLASLWESDISVHSLTLPSATCLELLLILSRSNAMLPPSLRQMNSFQVAFLKM
ncbi:E3 ubiquitin-protein ligase E3D [Octodon degus]|uniref:E3 ubiquitin-protein ligase E3D n=1 Tax=Octodon degus TaxID=10160 RepID=A0A6P6E6Q0_OCTDE|nr:E3 ubiquitin-protein ligase E3D [Octodon degus]